jgi:histidinol-phosphate aminotransferase
VDEKETIAALAQRGVLVRSGSALGRAGALRVTVGTEAENAKFLGELGTLLPN